MPGHNEGYLQSLDLSNGDRQKHYLVCVVQLS